MNLYFSEIILIILTLILLGWIYQLSQENYTNDIIDTCKKSCQNQTNKNRGRPSAYGCVNDCSYPLCKKKCGNDQKCFNACKHIQIK